MQPASSIASPPRVTVIIVSWNGLALLQRFLPSVAATTWPNLEIVLADNGSTDDSAEWVRAVYPNIRIEAMGANLGYCGGNNEAIRRTDGAYVVLLNNDVEVDPGWLAPLVTRAEADPAIGALQPKLHRVDGSDHFEYAGAAGGHLDVIGYPFARGRLFDTTEADRGQYNEPADIFWASGAALFLRRAALDRVGLLDERFEFHMEEIDLCWRLRRDHWRVVYEPASTVRHLGGGSLDRASPRKTYYNFRNSLLMLYKNQSAGDWYRVFPQRMLFDGAAIARFLARGELLSAWAVVRAYGSAHHMKSAYHPPAVTEVRPSYRGRIAIDYYLRRRRSFDQLPADRFEPLA